ncbi:unnamed protein product [Prorocentrum cordatum]|uniref:Cyclin n=1 Tax=Prorocentrum cordatum TaxID=2364126 RepID=A0ABN9VQB3_9DINO|nr:unnamed protein product [Polarella glacialis]
MCSSPSTTVSTGSAQDTPAGLGAASCQELLGSTASLFIDSARLCGRGPVGHPQGVHLVLAGGPRAPTAGKGPAGAASAPGLVERVAEAMEGTIRNNAVRLARTSTLSVFDSSEVPPISLRSYLRRLQAAFRCGDSAFVTALVIMDRFLEGPSATVGARRSCQEPGRLTELNAHRLFLTCLVLAVKYSEDLTYGNSHYAKAGGVRLREVNRLERCLLIALDYNLGEGQSSSACTSRLCVSGRTTTRAPASSPPPQCWRRPVPGDVQGLGATPSLDGAAAGARLQLSTGTTRHSEVHLRRQEAARGRAWRGAAPWRRAAAPAGHQPGDAVAPRRAARAAPPPGGRSGPALAAVCAPSCGRRPSTIGTSARWRIRKRSRDVFYAGVWALYRGSGSRQNAECNSTMFVERVHNCCFGVSFLDYGLPPSFSLSLSVIFSPFSLAHPPPQHTASCPCLETAHLVVSLVLIKSSSAARADLVLGEVGNRPPEARWRIFPSAAAERCLPGPEPVPAVLSVSRGMGVTKEEASRRPWLLCSPWLPMPPRASRLPVLHLWEGLCARGPFADIGGGAPRPIAWHIG